MLALRAPRASLLPFLLAGLAAACGAPPPPVAPPAPAPPVVSTPKEEPIDTSPVPDPEGLVLLARVNKPDAIVSAIGSWTRLPLPTGSALVQAIMEESVADVVDLSQPIDAAVTVDTGRRLVMPLAAFSIAVKSYDQAKVKLGAAHTLVPGPNGQLRVRGLSLGAGLDGHESASRPSDEGEDDDRDNCVLAPAATGGRLVCGARDAVEALAPYLSRTMPRQKWSSDIHVELRPDPLRAQLQQLRLLGPMAARQLVGGNGQAIGDLVDATVGEVVDLVGDTQRLAVDAQIADSGIVASTRFEFQSNKSLAARVLTTNRADAPPPAFWHLPAETDLAFFGRGSDPKLFEHPRELVSNVILEAAESASMPEPERRALKELVVDRLLAFFVSGSGVYGKGFDASAVEKARAALEGVKPGDAVAVEEKRLALLEQVVGWHLYQVNEPVAKVGPMLKDLSTLWNKPQFAKWVKSKAGTGAKVLPRIRIAPPPAGVTLPKETVHLEVSIARDDVYSDTPAPAGKHAAPKKVPVKPVLFHVLAVPDGGATWLAFGLDAKLVAQKASASLASAAATSTLGNAAGMEALREGPINGGGFATLRGILVFTALDDRGDRSPFHLLGTLPHKGATPVITSGQAEGASANARGGASVGTLRISRAVIEDIVKLAMSSR